MKNLDPSLRWRLRDADINRNVKKAASTLLCRKIPHPTPDPIGF